LYQDDEDQTLLRMLQKHEKPWCDKCKWQIREAKDAEGSDKMRDEGERACHYICLLSYRYVIPDFGIDATVNNLPEWAK
jgi:hypothetical protein